MKFKEYVNEEKVNFSAFKEELLDLMDEYFESDWGGRAQQYKDKAKLFKDLEKYDYKTLSTIFWKAKVKSPEEFLTKYRTEIEKLL